MTQRCLLRCALALVLLPAMAAAHETIPADWCPSGTNPVIVASFSFTPTQLADYRQTQLASPNSVCKAKTCGIIDDWFWGQERASLACGAMGLRRAPAEDAIPFVQSPADFLSAEHHELYRFSDGELSGQCVVCRGHIVVPAKPVRRGD
jgi:hypothetical protein